MQKAERYPSPVFWALASTFVWGFAVAPYLRRGVRDVVLFLYRHLSEPLRNYAPLTEWTTLLTYPTICWTAAILLARAKRKGSRVFALTHVVAGFAWIAFVFYAAFLFSRAFKR